MRPKIAALICAIALAPAGFAEDKHSQHALPAVPTELLERRLPLRTGIGSAHDTVTTTSTDAQKFYDQGLAYLHDYTWIEAARSFHQALRLDANLALAHVGLSYAYVEVNQSAAARQALQRARALAGRVSEHDRRHILIRERQLEAEAAPGDAAKLASYRRTIADGLSAFPDDVELWLLGGMAQAATAADRGHGSSAASVRYYQRALALAPDHFAAHHYLTHAFENIARIDEALAHGARFAQLAPNVPHARHMFGHDLRRVGRIQDAIAEFEAADQLHVAYFKSDRVPPELDWHYEHNLDLLATSYQYAGQTRKAEPLLRTAFALPTANLVQAVNKHEWPMFLRARGRADEALTAAGTLVAHPNRVVQAIGHIESGKGWLMKRQFARAAAEANAALTAMKSGEAGSGLVALPFEELQGEFFLLTGQREKGRAMLQAMLRKARAETGPDEWSQTLFTLESVGRTARDAGDWALAADLARQMREHDPAYAGTHFALGLVANHAGDPRAAAEEFGLARKYWSNADADLPELREIQDVLQRRGD